MTVCICNNPAERSRCSKSHPFESSLFVPCIDIDNANCSISSRHHVSHREEETRDGFIHRSGRHPQTYIRDFTQTQSDLGAHAQNTANSGKNSHTILLSRSSGTIINVHVLDFIIMPQEPCHRSRHGRAHLPHGEAPAQSRSNTAKYSPAPIWIIQPYKYSTRTTRTGMCSPILYMGLCTALESHMPGHGKENDNRGRSRE